MSYRPMKKLFFLLAILVFCSSCTDEVEKPTTYQIFNNSNMIVTNVEYLDGTMYEVIVYHLKDKKILKQDTIAEIATKGGKTGLMNVPGNSDNLKVSFKFLPSKSPNYNDPWNIRFYLLDYMYIERGKNNILGINGGSFISDTIFRTDNGLHFLKAVRAINKSHLTRMDESLPDINSLLPAKF
jgi:hypothetical protein